MTRKKSYSTRRQPSSRAGVEVDQHVEFPLYRQWLYSLTREELLRAMQFEFIPADNPVGSASGSYDYDILVEMMKLQSQPPTPVHPRALGYSPRASQHGAQLDYEEIKQRAQPRMFQWEERQSRSPIHHTTGRSNRNNSVNNRRLQPRFDVVARKKQTSWGQILSMGRTNEQRKADAQILSGTRLASERSNGSSDQRRHFAMFLATGEAEPSSDTNGKSLQFPASQLSTTKSILRMIRVASRGYFLETNSDPTTVAGRFQSSSRIPYCAPWLNPTDRWFSLSFYLASRYQVALWASYCSQNVSGAVDALPPIVPPPPSIKLLSIAMPKAMCAAMEEVLKEDQRQFDCTTNKMYLRDSLVWYILGSSSLERRHHESDLMLMNDVQKQQFNGNGGMDWQALWRLWSSSPLTQVSCAQNKLRMILQPHLDRAIANEMEKLLLESVEESPLFDQIDKNAKPTGKKKKTKKKRSKQQNSAPPPSRNGLSTVTEEKSPVGGESSVPRAANYGRMSCEIEFEFPTQPASAQERNRNVIFALSLLDEALESAFVRVGLDPTPTFTNDELPNERKRLSLPVPAPSNLPWNQKPSTQKKRIENSHRIHRKGAKKPAKDHQHRQTYKPKEPKKAWVRDHTLSATSQSPIPEEEGYLRPRGSHSESSSLAAESGHSASNMFDDDWNNGLWEPGSDSKTPWPLSSGAGGSSDDSIVAVRGHWAQQGEPPDLPPNSSFESRAFHDRSFHPFAQSTNETPFFNGTNHAVVEDTTGGRGLDEWPFLQNRYQTHREHSILSEFFRSQEERIDDEEKLMAASTAASIASSTYKDAPTVTDVDDVDKVNDDQYRQSPSTGMNAIVEDDHADVNPESVNGPLKVDGNDDRDEKLSPRSDPHTSETKSMSLSTEKASNIVGIERNESGIETSSTGSLEPVPKETRTPSPTSSLDCRSPSPESPLTPPPTLSPILVSLADLRHLKTTTPERLAYAGEQKKSRSSAVSGSLPSSPVQKNGLTPSWSREDLRIAAFRDDHSIKQKGQHHGQPPRPAEPVPLIRPTPIKSLAKPIASSKRANFDFRIPTLESTGRREGQGDSCAQSETAVEGHTDDQQWPNEFRKTQSSHGHEEADNVTKDESTTITSALSNREQEEISSIREERNTFRDMCLTLGAEVAKLKAMLAAQKATAIIPPIDYADGMSHAVYVPGKFDPTGMTPFFHGIQRGKRLGPMSDAGLHRPGDHESQVSEDDVYEMMSKSRVENARRMSSSATVAGSDASVEFNSSSNALLGGPVGTMPVHDAASVQGLQSRLTKDIMNFLSATTNQLRKQDTKRGTAIERFTRLVNTLWPRAQVKMYGSHCSGLCLPSSDLDFVICLPAVHKNAPALAPGVLEGRNAINETSQKLLARELKGESWIDPRSIKLIERTVVPVIKVCTKDTRARMIALDISFDSPEHHGLVAIEMVAQVMDELPLIRPLVLVLKQFLLDRGLLTSYTGGVSSYCLFLMAARYLQDQPFKFGDCGSLLMGFLDFYGNCFDPRTTGISVRRKQYFARPNYAAAHHQAAAGQPMWTPSHQQRVIPAPPPPPQVVVATGKPDFRRRNSENAMSSDGAVRARPPRFQHGGTTPHRYAPHHTIPHPPPNEQQHNGRQIRPYTFDPLFVEDPLTTGNNVGRNAFRINQVQRAFSDAHRALVASLEWDINSSGEFNDGVDYPLLKCLLRSEDVVYEL